jgi:hypothetical protein
LIYFVAAGVFVHFFGLSGIGAGYALAWWVVLGLAVRALEIEHDISFTMRVVAISTLCGGTAWLGLKLFFSNGPQPQWQILLSLAGTAGGAVIVFIVTSLVWPGLAEIRALIKRMSGNRIP